jgi:hypothetical protein
MRIRKKYAEMRDNGKMLIKEFLWSGSGVDQKMVK